MTHCCYGTMVMVELRGYNDTFRNIGMRIYDTCIFIQFNLFSVDSVVLCLLLGVWLAFKTGGE